LGGGLVNDQKLKFTITFQGYTFFIYEIQEDDICVTGFKGIKKIFDLVLSRDLATLHLPPQATCWGVLSWSRRSEHINRNEHGAALSTRVMTDTGRFPDGWPEYT